MAIDFGAAEPKAQAAFALHRFGFGPRSGDIDRIASDARGALLSELKPGAGQIDDPSLPGVGAAFREAFAFRQQRKAERQTRRMQANAMAPEPAAKPAQGRMIPVPQQIYLAEAKARYDAALNAEIGLVERLVWFWSNHFCVSADKGPTRPICGAFEREAIRPHVLGKFSDMLLAVETHPAMLLYLDNARSIGPNSVAGLRRGKGLNENLARETLELHTLGVRTGYTQADVTNFAKVITGWTVRPPRRDAEHGGEFWFNERMHEPGPQTVIGKIYREDGFAQGRDVLETLAHQPATAKHIATKLAIHFVADTPPPPLVERLAKRFRDTGGDLLQMTRTLVTAPEAWQSRDKLKKPGEWTMAAMRASGLPVHEVRRVVNAQNLLGEPLWRPPAPKGFSDDSAAWLDGMAERLDIANQIGRIADNFGEDPDALVDAALGPLASRRHPRNGQSRRKPPASTGVAPDGARIPETVMS